MKPAFFMTFLFFLINQNLSLLKCSENLQKAFQLADRYFQAQNAPDIITLIMSDWREAVHKIELKHDAAMPRTVNDIKKGIPREAIFFSCIRQAIADRLGIPSDIQNNIYWISYRKKAEDSAANHRKVEDFAAAYKKVEDFAATRDENASISLPDACNMLYGSIQQPGFRDTAFTILYSKRSQSFFPLEYSSAALPQKYSTLRAPVDYGFNTYCKQRFISEAAENETPVPFCVYCNRPFTSFLTVRMWYECTREKAPSCALPDAPSHLCTLYNEECRTMLFYNLLFVKSISVAYFARRVPPADARYCIALIRTLIKCLWPKKSKQQPIESFPILV
jgi:hypothetical protein